MSPTDSTNKRSRPTRRYTYILLASLSVFGTIIYSASLVSWNSQDLIGNLDPFSTFSKPLSSLGQARYCTAEEISQGNWVMGEEIKDEDELRARYNYTASGTMTCELDSMHTRPLPVDGTTSEFEAERLQRAFLAARPILMPTRPGCEIHPFTRIGYYKRFLRSRAGLWIVGDSLTSAHTRVLFSMLWDSSSNLLIFHNMQLYLNPQHPDTAGILAEAGVTVERTKRPLLTFIRSDFVLSPDELVTAFPHATGRVEIRLGEQTPDWYGGFLEALGTPLLKTKEFYEEPSPLLVSFGPHWSDRLGPTLQLDELLEGYRNAVDLLERKVVNTPFPISLMFRTTAPGQIDCQASQTFDNTRADVLSPLDTSRTSFNFLSFQGMNDIVRAGHTSLRSPDAFAPFDNISTVGISNPPYTILEVFDMSAKRPEAHLSPPHDCLHWCEPGPQNWWNTLWWHQLMLEARNDDYND